MAGSAQELAGGKLLLDRPAEAVARLRLHRPDARNALDHELLDGICDAIASLDDGIETRCVIVTGTGRAFSAGYDIAGIPSDTFEVDAEALVAHPFTAALEAIASHPWPVVAAINGHALGGGLELALTCDLRVASAEARLGMPPAKLGLVYGHTGLQRFIDAIGVPNTKELFLTGATADARRGEQIGLVHRVTESEDLEAASIELASEIAANAPLSVRGNKRAIDALNSWRRLTPELEQELIELRRQSFSSEDMREGIAAFGEKRPPRWQGR